MIARKRNRGEELRANREMGRGRKRRDKHEEVRDGPTQAAPAGTAARSEVSRWREVRETRGRAGRGRCWPDGWPGWGWGKMTRLVSQALGSWGMEGAGPHQRGHATSSWQGPTLPRSARLCPLMCTGGGVLGPLGFPAPSPLPTGPSVLPGLAQPPGLGEGQSGGWWLEAPDVESEPGRRSRSWWSSGDIGLCSQCL